MRRLLVLGLLLLTACPTEDPDDPNPVGPPPANKGRIQGRLSPFQSSGGSAAVRPPPLQGERGRELARAISRAISEQRLAARKSALEVSLPDLPVILPPPGPPPLKRLPAEDPTIAGDVIVRFEQAGLSAQQALERMQLPGYRAVHKGYASEHLHLVGFEALDGHEVTVEETGQLVEELAVVPGVRFTEKNLRMYPFRIPNDPSYTLQWHYPALNLPAAWDVTTGNASVTVAVLDTGIRFHPDLNPRIVAGFDMISDVANAGDGNGRDSDPTDVGGDEPGGGSSWHGTHVAGTIGAATNNASGGAGVTWDTRIMPVRVLGKQGGSSFDIAAAMNWASGGSVPGVTSTSTPARIINMSLGGASPPQRTYQDVIDARVAAGVIFVIAAGNENTDATNTTPCNQNNVICVGSTNFAGKRSSFSNYGPPVDVMAPGGELREDLNGDGKPDGVFSTTFNDAKQPVYAPYQGTSMATPHVAGVLALMVAAAPNLVLSPAQAESILKSTASASSRCSEGCGAGLVNAQAAVKAAQGGTSTEPPRLGIATTLLSFQGSGTQRILVSNLGAGSLRVTATKTGPQASAVSFTSSTVTVPAFGTQPLEVTVNTGGLANGDYAATINLTGENASTGAAAGTAAVGVKIRVGTSSDLDAVIAFAWQDENKEWHVDTDAIADVRFAAGYQYSIDLAPRTYYTLATIDDDQDGEYFEDGERTGFWRSVGSFEPIPLAAQQVVTNINFDLVPLAPIDDTPALVIGSACTSDAGCPDEGRCVTSYPGGYCTRDCSSRACPTGSRCVDSGSSRLCLAACTGPQQGRSTCRTSYVCYGDGTGGGLCLPDCTAYNICSGTGYTCDTFSGYCE
jgi:serine protease